MEPLEREIVSDLDDKTDDRAAARRRSPLYVRILIGLAAGAGAGGAARIALGAEATALVWTVTQFAEPTIFRERVNYNLGLYAQDQWTHSRLTLNLGARYDYFSPFVERNDHQSNFDYSTGSLIVAGQDGASRSLVDSDYKDFAPRLGLAWRASDRMTLRTGYGIFYTPDVINTYRQLGFQEPFGEVSSITARPADPQNPLPVFTVDNPLTQATRLARNNRNGIQRNLRDGRVQQWNTSVQYLLTSRTLVEVAYHGARSVHLMAGLNYNETDPFPPQPPDFPVSRAEPAHLKTCWWRVG